MNQNRFSNIYYHKQEDMILILQKKHVSSKKPRSFVRLVGEKPDQSLFCNCIKYNFSEK